MEWDVGGQPGLVVGGSWLTPTAWPDPHCGKKPQGMAKTSGIVCFISFLCNGYTHRASAFPGKRCLEGRIRLEF